MERSKNLISSEDMASVEYQTKLVAAQRAFDTLGYNFGVSDPAVGVPFEFKYNGELPIWGIETTCGCTKVDISEDGVISGVLNLSKKDVYLRQRADYIEDEQGVMWQVQGKMGIPSDPRLKPVPLTAIVGTPVPKETKKIKVHFADEEPYYNESNKIVTINPNKLIIELEIFGFINLK